jgi:hypothetical protein
MVFTFSKNEKVNLATVAIITSLLLLPLNINQASLLLSLTDTESVSAQLSGQANFNINNETTTNTASPYNQSTTIEDFVGGIIDNDNWGNASTATETFPDIEDDLIPFGERQTLTSSEMDFNLFMESFANSIFNGTSIFGGVGTSMVNGIKVSGIGWDNNKSQLSVMLSGKPMEISTGGSNTASTKNDTMATTTTNSHNSVSVIAMRIPINLADILSLAQASSSQGMDSNSMMTGDMSFDPERIFPSDSFNPFSLLSSMQIGSSSLTNADFSVPQNVTMDLVGGNNNQEQQLSYSNKTTTADLLFVSVIPYTCRIQYDDKLP